MKLEQGKLAVAMVAAAAVVATASPAAASVAGIYLGTTSQNTPAGSPVKVTLAAGPHGLRSFQYTLYLPCKIHRGSFFAKNTLHNSPFVGGRIDAASTSLVSAGGLHGAGHWQVNGRIGTDGKAQGMISGLVVLKKPDGSFGDRCKVSGVRWSAARA